MNHDKYNPIYGCFLMVASYHPCRSNKDQMLKLNSLKSLTRKSKLLSSKRENEKSLRPLKV